MKAAVYSEHGGPEVLTYSDVPDPEPWPADVIVRVAASALNRLDLVQRNGWFTLDGFSLPHIAGMDVAGTVVAIGSDVDSVSIGQRVVVDPSMAEVSGSSKYSGMGDLYGTFGVIGANLDGGYADLCLAPASHVYPVPESVSLPEAASLPTVFATAWHALVDVAKIQAGETLLIHAAGSGVSSIGIQIAKKAGATVLATAGTDEKLEWAERMGADHVLNSRTGDVTGFAKEATDGRGVDLVFDHLGPALWEQSVFALRPRGRLVFCGNTTGNEVSVNLSYAYHFGIQFLGSDPYRHDEFPRILEAAWSGGYESIVDSQYPLSEAAVAQERMAQSGFMGKILLIP